MAQNEPAWTSETLARPHDTPDKSIRVRRMFNGIARRYELINTLFSAGRDAAWRREAVRLAQISGADDVLDVAAGTGNFARAFAAAGARLVVGIDFAHEMLRLATAKHDRDAGTRFLSRPHDSYPVGARIPARRDRTSDPSPSPTTCWCEADALRLPFPSRCCSVVSSAFGVRNFADLDVGLAEMFRVLRPGGRAVILEFTTPTNPIARALYHLYSQRLMPMAASIISRDRESAYRYLPRSVVSFPGAEQVCRRLRGVGFADVSATPLTLGIVTVYVARRDQE